MNTSVYTAKSIFAGSKLGSAAKVIGIINIVLVVYVVGATGYER